MLKAISPAEVMYIMRLSFTLASHRTLPPLLLPTEQLLVGALLLTIYYL